MSCFKKNGLKKIGLVCLAAVSLLSLAACGGKSSKDEDQTVPEVMYSNLTGKDMRAQLQAMLEDNSVEGTDDFFVSCENFGAAMPQPAGLTSMMATTDNRANYDFDVMAQSWQNKYGSLGDIDSRLAVLQIMGNYIGADYNGAYGSSLTYDMDMLSSDARFQSYSGKKNLFAALFNEVSVSGVDKANYAASFIDALHARGVSYLSSTVKIVSVLTLNSDENVLFVNHAGVMFEYKDYVYFVEKLDLLQPYQMTRYNTKQQLIDDLLSTDSYNGDDGSAPILLENDQIMQ